MNKRYWLRGGIVGIILTILQIVGVFVDSDFLHSFLDPLSLPIEFIVNNFSSCQELGCLFTALFVAPLVNITLGVVLGLLYGKIKNRNKI